jgi:hypothetical protein
VQENNLRYRLLNEIGPAYCALSYITIFKGAGMVRGAWISVVEMGERVLDCKACVCFHL